jgi:hypothetical protein
MENKIIPFFESANDINVSRESVNRLTPYEHVLTAAISNTYSQKGVVVSSKVKDKVIKSIVIKTSVALNKTPKN